MKKFENYTDAVVTGTYPDTVPVPASDPDLRDGMPWTDEAVSDIWGAIQAVLYAGNIDAPNGDAEAAGSRGAELNEGGSDFLLGMRRLCGYPGEIVMWAGAVDSISRLPDGVDARLLFLAGQVVAVADYQDLVDATWNESINASAPAFYRTSDAGGTTRSVSGAYYKLPDCRGKFIRSLAVDAGYDLGRDDSGNAAIPASTQLQSVGDHEHTIYRYDTGESLADNILRKQTIWLPLRQDYLDASTDQFVIYDQTISANRYAPSVPLEIPLASGVRDSIPAGSFEDTSTSTYYARETGDNPASGPTEVRPPNIAFHCMVRY